MDFPEMLRGYNRESVRRLCLAWPTPSPTPAPMRAPRADRKRRAGRRRSISRRRQRSTPGPSQLTDEAIDEPIEPEPVEP